MRSLTRDPGLADPSGVPPWTVFTQTLIHDFDTPALAQPRRARRSRSTRPPTRWSRRTSRTAGLLDTAVVVITLRQRRPGGRRGELLGDVRVRRARRGLRLRRHGDRRRPGDRLAGRCTTRPDGRATTVRGDVELFLDAYTGEFEEFVAAVREGRPPAVTGEDARRALAVALACIESVAARRPGGRSPRPTGELHPGRLAPRWSSSTCRSSSAYAASTTPGSPSRSGTGPSTTSPSWPRPVRTSRR